MTRQGEEGQSQAWEQTEGEDSGRRGPIWLMNRSEGNLGLSLNKHTTGTWKQTKQKRMKLLHSHCVYIARAPSQ